MERGQCFPSRFEKVSSFREILPRPDGAFGGMLYAVLWDRLNKCRSFGPASSSPLAPPVFSACPLRNFVFDYALVLGVYSHLLQDCAVDFVANKKNHQNDTNPKHRTVRHRGGIPACYKANGHLGFPRCLVLAWRSGPIQVNLHQILSLASAVVGHEVVWAPQELQNFAPDAEYLPQSTQSNAGGGAGAGGGADWLTMTFGWSASFVNAQMREAIQPATVQPSKKFIQKIAEKFLLFQPTAAGRKYRKVTIRKPNTGMCAS